jgi:hypothetical protein
LHEAASLLEQGRVEEADERGHSPEDIEQLGIKPIPRRERRLELPTGEKLLESQVVRGRMFLAVPPGHGGQLFTTEFVYSPAEGRAGDDSAKRLVTDGDVLTDESQVGRGRHVQTAADPDTVWRHVEVRAGTLVAGETFRREARRDMRLERRLVLGEPGVAVDAIERHTRIRNQLWSEDREVGRKALDE